MLCVFKFSIKITVEKNFEGGVKKIIVIMCSEADPCYYDFLVKEEIEKRVFFSKELYEGETF